MRIIRWTIAIFAALVLSLRCLYYVNKVRLAIGLRPIIWLRRGVTGQSYNCPLANSLDHGRIGVDGATLTTNTELANKLNKVFDNIPGLESNYVRAPDAFKDFVTAFDDCGDEDPELLPRVLGKLYRKR